MVFRGSIARRLISLSTLRRGGRPPTTQDSLPAAGRAYRSGLVTRRVPYKRFQACSCLLSRASWQVSLCFCLSSSLLRDGDGKGVAISLSRGDATGRD